MSFTTPQQITIATVVTSLDRTITDRTSSVYSQANDLNILKISHQEAKSGLRHLARLDRKVVAADPLTAQNAEKKAAVYLVIEEPSFGFSKTDLVTMAQEFLTWLTQANLTAFVANRH